VMARGDREGEEGKGVQLFKSVSCGEAAVK
jgi:hypothetical protein